jgi:DNA-binding transcriptional LysR family regulator
LFERSRAGARLTAAGQRLMPYAARLDALLEEAAVPRATTARRAACCPSARSRRRRRSPVVAARLLRRGYPQVDLVLRTGTTGELIERVLSRELEGAFVCGPVAHAELVATPCSRRSWRSERAGATAVASCCASPICG